LSVKKWFNKTGFIIDRGVGVCFMLDSPRRLPLKKDQVYIYMCMYML